MVIFVDPVDAKPTVTLDAPTDGTVTSVYAPNASTALPKFVGTKGSAVSNTVTLVATFSNTSGTVSSATSAGGWDNLTGIYTKTTTIATVNAIFADWKYNSNSTDDTMDKSYNIQITNADSDAGFFCGTNPKLVTADVLKTYIGACYRFTLATGTAGSNVQVLVNGIPAHSPAVAFNTNLATTQNDLINAIQTQTTTPDYGATLDSGSVKLCAATQAGADANGDVVSFIFGGSPADITQADTDGTGLKLTKGVTGKTDPRIADEPQWYDGLFGALISAAQPLVVAANILFSSDPFNSSAKFEITRDPNNPVRDLKFKIRGRTDIPIPDVFDPGTPPISLSPDPPNYTGAWDLTTFITGYTTDPAWCTHQYLTGTDKGQLGNIIPISNVPRLRQQILDGSERNIEGVGTELRNTINQAILTNKISKGQLLINMLTVWQAVYHWKDGFQIYQDRPGAPTFILNHTVALEPGFTYTGESLKTKFNVVNIGWYNLTKPPSLETDTIESTSPTLPEKTSLDIVGWGIAQQGQAHRKAVDLLTGEAQADPLTATVTIGHIGELLNPGDRVRLLDPWFQFSTTKKNAGRVLSVTNLSNIVVSIENGATISGTPSIHIMKNDSSIFTTTVASFVDNGNKTANVGLTAPMPSTPVDDTLFNIEDGINMTIIAMLERDEKARWEVELVFQNDAKYAEIDTATTPV